MITEEEICFRWKNDCIFVSMLSEEEILVKLHEAEGLFQEHGVEVLSSNYEYNADRWDYIHIRLCDDYTFYKYINVDNLNVNLNAKWYLINTVLINSTIGDLDELIMIWKNRQ